MKRSEMKKEIKDYLFEHVIGHFLSLDGDFGPMIYDNEAEKFAETLLTKIEERGMLPPGREEDKITFSYLDGTIKGYSYDQYVWDDENELTRSGAT